MIGFISRLLDHLRGQSEDAVSAIYRSHVIEFHDFPSLERFHRNHFETNREVEAELSRRGGQVEILRPWANEPEPVSIETPATFLDMYNFRESFVDSLGLNARQRQLFLAVQSRLGTGSQSALLLEHRTALHDQLNKTGLSVTSSHYVENRDDPHFQDMQRLTYADNSFDFVIHSDVLEHVPDYRTAVKECLRVLKPGGMLIYTAPFFPIAQSILRAEHAADGSLIRHFPDEIHGDNLTGGILAYHNFGWDLVEAHRADGFMSGYVEVCLSPSLGLYSSNCPIWTDAESGQPGNMLPLVLIAQK